MKQRLIDPEEFLIRLNQYSRDDGYINLHMGTITTIVDNTPTIEERPQGKWRMAKGQVDKAICEHCGMLSIVEPFGKPPYCQWCGAKMKEGDEK